MSKFEVFLKDGTKLDFDGKCNHYTVTSSNLILFINNDGDESKVLAAIPYENISYIRSYPYMSVQEAREYEKEMKNNG